MTEGAVVLRCTADENGVGCVEVEMKPSPDALILPPPPPLQVAQNAGATTAKTEKTTSRGQASSTPSTSVGTAPIVDEVEPSRPKITARKVKSPFGETRVSFDALLPGKPGKVTAYGRLSGNDKTWNKLSLTSIAGSYAWKGVLVLVGETKAGATVEYYLTVETDGNKRNIGSSKKPSSFKTK